MRLALAKLVKMSFKHLKTGDALPPLAPGVLRLYSMTFCPFAERARLVLAAKGIDYELVNVNTYEKPDWFFDKNRAGLVPVLEQDDKLIPESLIVCDYLDDLNTGSDSLYPSDPYLKALDKLLIHQFGTKFVPHLFKSGRELGTNEELKAALLADIQFVEDELKRRATYFFGGSSPGMVDFVMWPFVYRVPVSKSLGVDQDIPETFVLLNEWIQRMRSNDVVAPRIIDDEAMSEFQAHYRTPDSKFDGIQMKAIPN